MLHVGVAHCTEFLNFVYLMFTLVLKTCMSFDGYEENAVKVILLIDEVIFVITL